jgi:hypothetical protein
MANCAILDFSLLHSLRLGQPGQEEHSHELENQTEARPYSPTITNGSYIEDASQSRVAEEFLPQFAVIGCYGKLVSNPPRLCLRPQ